MDEVQSLDVLWSVQAKSTHGACWLWQKSALFVEANGIDRKCCALCQLANLHRSSPIEIIHSGAQSRVKWGWVIADCRWVPCQGDSYFEMGCQEPAILITDVPTFPANAAAEARSEEHTSELQSRFD